jgi:hypothetical protein
MKTRNKVTKLAPLAGILLVNVLQPAFGQIVYSTGFEPPTFVADLPLAGQDGWIAPSILSPNAAVVTTDKPSIGSQTVRVRGADLVHQDFINSVSAGFYDAINSSRHAVNYDTAGTQILRVSANVRVDGAQTAAGNHFFSASVTAIARLTDGSSEQVGELAISSDGHVYGYSGNDFVPTFLASAPVTLGEWHNLAVHADFAARTYSLLVDDQFLGTFPFDSLNPGHDYTNILRRGSIISYAAPDTATLKKADYTAHFDNFFIQAGSATDAN